MALPSGITQSYPGIPLSPTLFNVVVDTIICHWLTMVAATEAGIELLVLLIWYLVEYFSANDGIIASTQSERLQRSFDVLAGLFGHVGLRTIMRNMVSVDCQPCHTPGRMLVVAYDRFTMGTGPTY